MRIREVTVPRATRVAMVPPSPGVVPVGWTVVEGTDVYEDGRHVGMLSSLRLTDGHAALTVLEPDRAAC